MMNRNRALPPAIRDTLNALIPRYTANREYRQYDIVADLLRKSTPRRRHAIQPDAASAWTVFTATSPGS